ncbi:hypothetical protein CerSpe_270410 [Prunus speciosa]
MVLYKSSFYTEEQLMKLFKSHDKNRDGQLSKDELIGVFKELGSRWPTIRASLAMMYADGNRDGFISLKEDLNKLVKYVLELGFTLR